MDGEVRGDGTQHDDPEKDRKPVEEASQSCSCCNQWFNGDWCGFFYFSLLPTTKNRPSDFLESVELKSKKNVASAIRLLYFLKFVSETLYLSI